MWQEWSVAHEEQQAGELQRERRELLKQLGDLEDWRIAGNPLKSIEILLKSTRIEGKIDRIHRRSMQMHGKLL